MELSSSNIKKIINFLERKLFLYFFQMKPCTFQPELKNITIHPKKISCASGKRNPEKTFYIFLKRKLFL